MKNQDNHVITRGFAYLFLGVVCLLQLLPFWLAICTASKPATDLSSTLVPRTKDIEWSNFTLAITEGGVLRAMVNSAIITVCATVLTCVIGAMAAYPLARRLSKFNKAVSTVILSLMMIPPLSVLVPVYSMMVKIGGVNTYWGIILLSTAGNLPLAIFLYTSFIKAIPESIDEAGMIDGANRATIFFRLIMPLLKPVTATVIIMTSVGVNPYLMGIVMIVNLGIGMITPPVGNCLYVACGMSKRLSFEQISKACIPYIVMLMIALLLITYVEPISMGLIWLTSASAI